MNEVVWFKDRKIKISGVGLVAVCLRQFRTSFEKKRMKSVDYEIEKKIIDFEETNKIRIFVDEKLNPYYIKDKITTIKERI